MFVDILYCSFLFALLAGLWLLNQPRKKLAKVPLALKLGLNLLGGVLALGAIFFWLKTINEAPFQPIIKPGTHRLAISAEQWGKTWPLRVPSGTLECLPGAEVVFHTQGKTFAVNGQAKLKALPKIESLASPDKYIPKARKDLSGIQRLGLRLCQ